MHKKKRKAKENSEDNREFWELGAGIVLFIAGKALESSKPVYSMVCFILAYLILGIKIVWTALKNISKGQVFDENFLMSIATISAFGVGEFAEAVGVMMFYRIGELFEEKLWNEVVPRSWMSLICDLKLSTLLMIMEMSL